MKKSEILRHGRHYKRTGEIRDELVPFFDQSGMWLGDLQLWQLNTHLDMLDRMRGAVLPVSRRTVRCRAGLRLLTSFVWDEPEPAWITYVEVGGSIRLSTKARVYAPNLRCVGGSLVSKTNAKVDFPQLRNVNGDLDVGTGVKFHARRLRQVGGNMTVPEYDFPFLRAVGGSLVIPWARSISAPQLRTVGASVEARFIRDFVAPELREVGRNFTIRGIVERIFVPKLETIRGEFLADQAIDISANRLRSVGLSIHTRKAKNFYRGTVKVGGKWYCHPDAKSQWEINEIARSALRDPGIEL
ncbi:MAG: hypothetical protein KDN05_00665 [Verrucomicrobiae bacterium]|nr:hypothetical protein [Verrucomicrobiae bacterium]